MSTVNLADAKARLSAIAPRRQAVEFLLLRALTDPMTLQPDSAGEFIRQMRDNDRY